MPVGNCNLQRRPITVAGPWPIFAAFPFPRPYQFSIEVYAARRLVSTTRVRAHFVAFEFARDDSIRWRPIHMPAHLVNPPAALDDEQRVPRDNAVAAGSVEPQRDFGTPESHDLAVFADGRGAKHRAVLAHQRIECSERDFAAVARRKETVGHARFSLR